MVPGGAKQFYKQSYTYLVFGQLESGKIYAKRLIDLEKTWQILIKVLCFKPSKQPIKVRSHYVFDTYSSLVFYFVIKFQIYYYLDVCANVQAHSINGNRNDLQSSLKI